MSVKGVIVQVIGLYLLCTFTEAAPKNTECGTLANTGQLPWTVGIYLEKEKNHLELVCLGTVLKEKFIITAAQCVCESFSSEVRTERIFVSPEIQKQLGKNSNAVQVKAQDVISRSDYIGFLLNPVADLAVLRLKESQKFGSSVCVDWTDFNFPLEDGMTGILPLGNNGIKPLDTSFLDFDSCSLSTSEDFGRVLGHDKHCFKISASSLVPESIGSGIYLKNPKDGKWYLEGVVSHKEMSQGEVFVAATSVRHYLPWLSRICS